MSNDIASGERTPVKKASKKPKREHAARSKAASALPTARERASEYQKVLDMPMGAGRTIAEQIFQRTYVKGELLEREAGLVAKRWIGYGYMSPLVATQVFLQDYIAAYRRAWGQHIDSDTAALKCPCPDSLGMLNQSDMTCIWKVRQLADELGMPYDLFCDITMDQWVRAKKARLPLPNQLTDKLSRAWMRGRPTPDEFSARFMSPGWDERFWLNHGVDDLIRLAFLKQVHFDVFRPGNRMVRLARYMGADGVLTRDEALTICDADTVEWSEALVGARDILPNSDADYVPACIGGRTTKEPCKSCPWADGCSGVKERATKVLVRRHGTTDPIAVRERALNAERQRNKRARDRAALDDSGSA